MKRPSVPAAVCGNCGPGAIRVGDKFGMISVHLAPETRRSSTYNLPLCEACVELLKKKLPKVGEILEGSLVKATEQTKTLTFLTGKRGRE